MRKHKRIHSKPPMQNHLIFAILLVFLISMVAISFEGKTAIGYALRGVKIPMDESTIPKPTPEAIQLPIENNPTPIPIQNLDVSPVPSIIPTSAPSSMPIPNQKSPSLSGNAKRLYFFANGQRIGSVENGKIEYAIGDQLGSSSLTVDSTGLVNSKNIYNSFGTSRQSVGNEKFKFTGKELDKETGIYYYGARYYEPLIGRFLEADSLMGDLKSPQSMNRYSYVRNNPLILNDPTGNADRYASSPIRPDWTEHTEQTAVAGKYSPDQGVVYLPEANQVVTAERGECDTAECFALQNRVRAQGMLKTADFLEQASFYGLSMILSGLGSGVASSGLTGMSSRMLIGAKGASKAIEGAIETEVKFVAREPSTWLLELREAAKKTPALDYVEGTKLEIGKFYKVTCKFCGEVPAKYAGPNTLLQGLTPRGNTPEEIAEFIRISKLSYFHCTNCGTTMMR